MDKNKIYKLIEDAKESLKEQAPKKPEALATYNEHGNKSVSIKTPITASASQQYFKCASRIFGTNSTSGELILPSSSDEIIDKVKASKKKNTLKKYARSVRHVSLIELSNMLKLADKAQRSLDWVEVERIVTDPNFNALTTLAKMLPSDYTENWQAESPRKGKKSSLKRLPLDWREQMYSISSGQFKLPMLVSMLTGCRPAELEKGVIFNHQGNRLIVKIQGAKVRANAGQEYRVFEIANHPLKQELIKVLSFDANNLALVPVEKGNSVTTFMRKIGKQLWPRRKESITCYTARHSMAAECKQASANGSDPDLVSKVLGHIVDKTASYYGNRFQSGGISVAPSSVKVAKEVKLKSKVRSKNRLSENKIPSNKRSGRLKLR